MVNSPLDEIKNRLDIVEVIGSYIKLQKAGANFRAVCPFHSEKKPSFFVSPVRQIWHCFGCGKGGDIFGFIKEIENIEFGDALKILAQRAGVELKREKPELKTERSRLYEVCELATKFFEKQLQESKIGNDAKEYLLGRGISQESIKKWRIGYAPDVWQGLADFLTSRSYSKAEIERAGLGLTSEKGSFYDRFRGRIIFPIFDLNSQVVGFGGRVFKEKDNKEIAKYVNTPNTLLYDKSRILYGLDRAKMEIRKKDFCILVEGYTDVIMSHQVGIENVVSTSGTALSSYQLKILKRYSENLYTAFDMDVAGDSATKRGIDLAQAMGFNIKVLLMPKDSDPADIISQNPKEWEKILEKARPIMDFYFETTFSHYDSKKPENKKTIAKILLPLIKRIPNNIEKSYWVQELAKKLQVKEDDVVEELKKIKLTQETPLIKDRIYSNGDAYSLETEEMINLPQKPRKELLQERLITLILKFPQCLNLVDEKEREILANLKNKATNNEEYFNYLCLKSEVDELLDDSSYLKLDSCQPFLNGEATAKLNEKDILSEIQFCLKEMQFLEIKSRLNQLSQEIKLAENEKDFQKAEKLIQEFNQLSKKII